MASKRRKGVRTWRKFRAGADEWRICLVDESSFPEIRGKHGLTDLDARTVYLHRDAPPSILMHELKHVAWFVANLSSLLQEKFGLTDEQWDELEEALVDSVSHQLHDILDRNRWLRFPKLPSKKPTL